LLLMEWRRGRTISSTLKFAGNLGSNLGLFLGLCPSPRVLPYRAHGPAKLAGLGSFSWGLVFSLPKGRS